MKSRGMGLGMAAVLAFGTITITATMAAQTSTPMKDDLFSGTEIFAKGASDVTEITMDPESLGLVGGNSAKKAHSTILNVVRTYSYDKPGMYKIEDVEAFRNKLNTGEWHCSVHTRSLKTGESTDICNKQRTDGLAESAIITVEPKELTFIHTIRKKGEGESEVGEMPLMMLNGLPAMAMMDANMALMKARLQTMDGTTLAHTPKSFFLEIPDGSDAKQMLDSEQNVEIRSDAPNEVQKRLLEQLKKTQQQDGNKTIELQDKNSGKQKKSFMLAVPNDQPAPQPQEQPAPQAPSQPQ